MVVDFFFKEKWLSIFDNQRGQTSGCLYFLKTVMVVSFRQPEAKKVVVENRQRLSIFKPQGHVWVLQPLIFGMFGFSGR